MYGAAAGETAGTSGILRGMTIYADQVFAPIDRDRFPNTAATARGLADVWGSDPDRWWPDTVDLLVFGLEAILRKGRKDRPE